MPHTLTSSRSTWVVFQSTKIHLQFLFPDTPLSWFVQISQKSDQLLSEKQQDAKKNNSAKNGGFKNQILITWRYSCQVDGKEAVHHIQTGKSPWVYFTANYSGLTY